MIIRTFVIGILIVGITFILTELHRYQVYKREIEQDTLNKGKEVKHGQVQKYSFQRLS